jgi:predicted secreted protein
LKSACLRAAGGGFLVVFLAGLTGSCAGKPAETVPANGREVVEAPAVGEDDNGRLLVTRRGNIFTLSLPANGTAGYQWREDRVDAQGLTIVGRRFKLDSDRIGAAGRAIWEIQALQPGEWQIEMSLCQPWDCDRTVEARYALSVFVRSDSDR